jgi:hypothetical protein
MKNKPTPPSDSLLEKLTQADICCRECGQKYGVYSVGVSSTWIAECPICGETKGCTETRDWGYLTKGINELKAWRPAQPFSELTEGFPPERIERIKEQSKILAEHLATVGPIMTDEELEKLMSATSNKLFEDDTLNEINNDPLNYAAPYELGEITLKLTEEEVAFLNECLDTIVENHPTLCPGHTNEDPADVPLFEGIEKKITALYDDNCVRYELAPAMKAYIARYGSIPGPDDDAKWEIFRDTYNWLIGEGSGNE